MKTRAFSLSVGLLPLLLCCGCGKTFRPGFPEELRDWLPYQNGRTLTFANDKGDTITSKIKEFHVDEDYSFQNCTKCDRGAHSHMFFTCFFDHGNPGFPLEEFGGWSGEVWFKQNLLEFSLTFTYSSPGKEPDILKAWIPSTSREPVIVTTPDMAVTRFDSARFEKGRGIASFHDTQLDCNWTLTLVEDRQGSTGE